MRKHFILLMALLTLCIAANAQEKIVLHKGNEKETITKGKVIGVTLKGEDYPFSQWKNVYKTNNLIRQHLWEVDNIGPDSVYLSGYEIGRAHV